VRHVGGKGPGEIQRRLGRGKLIDVCSQIQKFLVFLILRYVFEGRYHKLSIFTANNAPRQRGRIQKGFKGPLPTPPGPLRGKLCLGNNESNKRSVFSNKLRAPQCKQLHQHINNEEGRAEPEHCKDGRGVGKEEIIDLACSNYDYSNPRRTYTEGSRLTEFTSN